MKKRAFPLLFFLLVFCAGTALAQVEPRGYAKGQGYQYYNIGTYPQTADGQSEPLLWRALSVENGQALMLTEYVIDAQQVIFETDEEVIAKHAYRRIASFAESDLCGWLNTVMLQKIMADTELEQALVAGDFGKLYLLTDDQLLTPSYGFSTARFGSVPTRCCKVTAYAKTIGVYGDANGAAPYWVAAIKAADGYKMQIVGFNGHLSYGAYTRTNIGIRPAMTIDLSLCEFIGGDGSKDSPFQLVLRPQAGKMAQPKASVASATEERTSALLETTLTATPTVTATQQANVQRVSAQQVVSTASSSTWKSSASAAQTTATASIAATVTLTPQPEAQTLVTAAATQTAETAVYPPNREAFAGW